jgi:hypothetical protein
METELYSTNEMNLQAIREWLRRLEGPGYDDDAFGTDLDDTTDVDRQQAGVWYD